MDATLDRALRLGPLALALALCAGAQAAVAQDVEGDKRRASALLDEGNTLFAEQRYEAAKDRYDRAYAAYPSPKILLNLAEVHRALGLLDRAADDYERFLAQSGPGTDDKHRALAERRVAELAAQLGGIALDGPAGTAVAIDGQPRGELPRSPVRVMAGRRTVTAGAFREDVMVRASQITQVSIPAEPTPEIVVAPTPAIDAAPVVLVTAAPEEEPASGSVFGSWWFWTGVGVIAVGAVAVGMATASGGDDFVPGGELGRVSTAGWETFTPGAGR